MYQFNRKKLPTYFSHYFTYSSDISSYSTRHTANKHNFIPRFASSKSQRSLKYAGAKIWNNIPTDIKNKSFIKFKERYKKLLLIKYIVE